MRWHRVRGGPNAYTIRIKEKSIKNKIKIIKNKIK